MHWYISPSLWEGREERAGRAISHENHSHTRLRLVLVCPLQVLVRDAITDVMNEVPQPSRHTYPLSALFVLMAGCAVVASLVTPVARAVVAGKVGVPETITASVMGTILVTMLAGLIGLYHYRQWRGFLWGILTGALLGVVIGPVALAPIEAVPSIFSMSLLGGVMLVVIGAIFRFASQ